MSTASGDRVGARHEGSPFTRAEVEAVLDGIRPYIRSHGGNIELVAVEGPNVRVILQGSCTSCPSSTVTLQHGVEQRMREELAGFGELITDSPAHEAPPREGWWRRLVKL